MAKYKFSSTANSYYSTIEQYIKSLDYTYAKEIRYIEGSVEIYMENKYGHLPTAGEMLWPVLEPNHNLINARFVPFNIAWSKGITDCIVHFYIGDRLFMRVFRNPYKYMPFLKRCKGVIGPDMSQYTDMPFEMRRLHAFCNMSLSSDFQNYGVNLFPNITWSKSDSFPYSFPLNLKGSVIAINSNGIHSNDLSLYRWREGYRMALKILQPSHILRYGMQVDGENVAISSYYENERLKLLRNGWKRKQI